MALGAAVSHAADYTTTTTGTGEGSGTYHGWCTALDHSYLNTTPAFAVEDEVLTLNSISINGGTGSGGTLTEGIKLAIFAYVGDSNVGAFVGISDNTATREAGKSFTFTFTGVELEVSQQYQFLYVTPTTTADTFTSLADGATMLTTYQGVSGSVRHHVWNHASIPSGDGTYKGNGINSWEGYYVTDATYSLSSVTIPEPATATLSLLALAGLAARRRRK